ncbi:MAG: hypothetical protein JXO22_03620 [Phycisphaerae bacterium]|nr:hypothetical protein [Phycisphaerae bacterium]
MTSRELFLAALHRQQPERLPMCDLVYWPETLARWRDEGLPPDADLVDYFGLDRLVCINDLFEPSFGLPQRTIEETETERVYVDGYGKTMRAFKDATVPAALVEPAIRTREDWQRVAASLTPGEDKFNNPVADADYQAARAAGHFIAITPCEPVWFVLEHCMGFELGLAAMVRQRELVSEMITAYTDYLIGMLERTLARGYRFDALWFWSDLCYRNGMLFSPRMARTMALPHWQRLGQFIHDNGMRFMFHCDGNVAQLIPLLIEAGVDSIHPLEARAGNDVREYKQSFGDQICLIGNINADIVATNDPSQIEREVADKIPAAMKNGGYIYHIDHSVPPTVSLESYKYLLTCVRQHATGA